MYLKIFSCFIILMMFYSCSTINPALFKKKPEAHLENTDIESISLRDITLRFDVKITNPYPLGITLDKISSKFTVEGNQLFETATKDQLKILANNSAMNSFNVNMKFIDIINIIKDYSKKDNLNCKVDGEIVLAIPKTGIPGIPPSYSFPYSVTKQIPTLKPSVSINNFTIKQPSKAEILDAIKTSGKNLNFLDVANVVSKLLAGNYAEAFKVIKPEDLDLKFDVNFSIELKNDTAAKISFNRFNYDFYLNNDRLVQGETTDIKTIDNKTILNVRSRISMKSFSQSIVKAFQTKTGDFHLQGETAIKLPDAIKKEPLKLLFDEKGSLKVTTQ